MAAAKLVTRCPACRTAFRLVADQLRLRQGLVRCGQCDTVFDAREHLIELPAPEPASEAAVAAEAAASVAAPAPPQEAAPEKPHRRSPRTPHEKSREKSHEEAIEGAHDTAHGRAPRIPRKRHHAEAHPETAAPDAPGPHAAEALAAPQEAPHDEAAESGEDRPYIPPFDPGFDPGYDVPALDAPTVMLYQTQAEADQAVHAVNLQAEPETGAVEAGEEAEAASAVFVPGIVDGEAADVSATDQAIEASGATEAVEPTQATELADATEASDATHTASVADIAGAAADAWHEAGAPAAGDTPAATPQATPWPQLDPGTLADDLPPQAAPQAIAGTTALDDDAEREAQAAHGHAAQLPPLTAGDNDATHAADTAQASDAVDDVATAGHAPASARAEADAAAVPSASGYLRAEAQSDFPEIPEPVAREQASRLRAASEEPAAPAFAPDFLRHARERGPGPARRKRTLQRLAIALLVLAGLVQATYLARSQLSGRFPMLRPAFEAVCAPLGCEVAPWRDIDALRIESSLLQKQEEDSDAYLLAVTLRNQGRATVALPAIELVMTDLQDQLLLRKVLQPADYLDAGQRAFATHGLRAGTELPVRVRFRSQQAAANYRVLIFYP